MSDRQRPVKYRERAKKTILDIQATAWMLYIYSMPFLFAALWHLISGRLWYFLISFGCFLGVLLSAVWMSKGRKNKYHFQKRKYTLQQPFPLMFLASLSLGVTAFAGSFLVAGLGILSAIGHGIAATVGSWLWYGLDAVGGSAFDGVKDKDSQTILAVSEQSIVNIEQAEKNKQDWQCHKLALGDLAVVPLSYNDFVNPTSPQWRSMATRVGWVLSAYF